MTRCDILIRGGTIVDGSGNEPFVGDLAITGDTIAWMGAAYQGAALVAPGVWMYQMTDKGLAAEITAKGTKYYRNDELN